MKVNLEKAKSSMKKRLSKNKLSQVDFANRTDVKYEKVMNKNIFDCSFLK